MKEKIIVYALGDYWKKNKGEISEQYDIIACCDQNPKAVEFAKGYKFIYPENIPKLTYDKIILGSCRAGIREVLAMKYDIPFDKIYYGNEKTVDIQKRLIKEANKYKTQLSIVIPTYNRKERLKRTLGILERQSNNNFNIIILDNCSDYNIDDLLKTWGKSFQEKITILRNKKNIGMTGNIANAFIQDVEGWLWTLADDDIPSVYAIEDILEEVEASDNVGIVSFSLHDFSKYMPDGYRDFKKIYELTKFYQDIAFSEKDIFKFNGDFIYFSNKIYNMKLIKEYSEKIFYYSYSGVPHIIPILFMLNENKGIMRISNKKIVGYDTPDGDHWNWIKIALGMRIISDIQLDIDAKTKNILYRLIMLKYDELIENVNRENIFFDIEQLEKLYNEVYKCFLTKEEKYDFKEKINVLKNTITVNKDSKL